MEDFEVRTLRYSLDVLRYCKKKKLTTLNRNYIVQLLKSSSSVGANYREANSALSFKDCLHRLRISRKEAKETSYWLEILFLLEEIELDKENNRQLYQEATELAKILSTMIKNKKNIQNEF